MHYINQKALPIVHMDFPCLEGSVPSVLLFNTYLVVFQMYIQLGEVRGMLKPI
jgi:hypothetical protein